MKYLKSRIDMLNNLSQTRPSQKNRKNIKSQIGEILYILKDVNISVNVNDIRLKSGPWTNAIALKISMYPSTLVNVETDYLLWIDSLCQNNDYLEFIDRVEEICKSYGKYDIFVQRLTINEKDHYRFDEAIIAENENEAKPSERDRWIEIEDAIINGSRSEKNGFLGRIRKIFNKK